MGMLVPLLHQINQISRCELEPLRKCGFLQAFRFQHRIFAKTLHIFSGPVYDINREHKYAEIKENIVELKNLQGPVYAMERAHQYDGQMDKVEHERALNGPVYEIFRQHNFGEIEKQLTDLRTLTGPCYDIEARNHKFHEIDH